jgi:hypothetical protein
MFGEVKQTGGGATPRQSNNKTHMKTKSINTKIRHGYPSDADQVVVTDEMLQEAYANARTTGAMALGHGKGDANKHLASRWLEMMNQRAIQPDGREGRFNGNGTT